MMEKRDLKADLELFNRATPGPWEFGPIYAGTIAGELDEERHRANRELLNGFREGWPHAIERALEAEALARELVEVLEGVQRLKPLIAYPDDVLPEFGEEAMAIANMLNVVDSVVSKAKEVLGDV